MKIQKLEKTPLARSAGAENFAGAKRKSGASVWSGVKRVSMCAVAFVLAFGVGNVAADDYNWQGDSGSGGTGTWNTTNTNWTNTTTSTPNTTWGNTTSSNATFGGNFGTAQTITVGTVIVGNMTANSTGSGTQTFNGGSITFSGGSLTATSNGTTINSNLIGSIVFKGGVLYSSSVVTIGNGTLTSAELNLGTSDSQMVFKTTALSGSTSVKLTNGFFGTDTGTLTYTTGSLEFAGGAIRNRATSTTWNASSFSVTSNSTVGTSNAANSFTLNGNGTLSAARFLTLGGGQTVAGGVYTLNGSISGQGGLIIASSSTTLTGANSYTGATSVNAGNLTLTGGSAIDNTGAVILGNATGVNLILGASEAIGSLAGGGTLGGNVSLATYTLTTGGDNTSTAFAGVISGTGGVLAKTGTGTLTLSGINTYSGGTTIQGSTGSVVANSSGALGSGDVLLQSTNTGTGNILSIGGNSTIANNITVDSAAGRNNIGLTGSGSNNFLNGNITISGAGATHQIITTVSGSNLTINGNITRSGSFSNYFSPRTAGTTTLTINGKITLPESILYCAPAASGIVLINSTGNNWKTTQVAGVGTLQIGSSDALATSANLNFTSNGTVKLNGYNQTFAGIENTAAGASGIITNGGASNSVITLSGLIADKTYSATITDGSGGGKTALVMNSAGRVQTLSGVNTYTGTTTINAGTLNAGIADGTGTGALGNGGNITFGGGILQYSAASAGSDYSARFKNSTGAIALDTNSQSVSLSGIIDSSNTGGLVKTGTGTLTLGSANTYTGATTVSSGTLVLSASGSINSSSSITVATGAILTNNNTGTPVNRDLTLSEGATLNGSGSFTPTNITIAGDLTSSTFTPITLTDGSTLNVTSGTRMTFSFTNLLAGNYTLFSTAPASLSFSEAYVGALGMTKTGETFSASDSNFTYTWVNGENTIAISAVPEPKVWGLIGFGIGFTLFRFRARQRRVGL